jgi:hypothetical protein
MTVKVPDACRRWWTAEVDDVARLLIDRGVHRL